MLDPKLLEILACPECKGPVEEFPKQRLVVCRRCRLGYPLSKRGAPVMLASDAIDLPPSALARRK